MRIASQWTHDPEAVGSIQTDEEEWEEEASEEVVASHEVAEEEREEAAEAEGEVPEEDLSHIALEPPGALQRWRLKVFKALRWDARVAREEARVRVAIKAEYHRLEDRLKELRDKKASLEKQLGHDFGPEGQFISLLGKCFSGVVEKYTYEVCPYASAAQKEGSSSTSLGHWRGFQDNYTALSFADGQHCWNGPLRSIKVALVCGQEDVLRSVTEPNRCEYHAELQTPAACTPAYAQAVRNELARIEAELTGHDEL
jgi:Glucosidase II beta subunit-like protein